MTAPIGLPEEEDILTVVVPDGADGGRTDAILASLTELSRASAARLTEEGRVRRGGTPLNKKTPLRAGDTVEIFLPPPVPCEAQPENIPLDIVYEDADVIVVSKPKGMVVHPAPGHTTGTLVSALLYHCGDSLSGIGGVARPGIVHRIDQNTTGLIAAAKTDAAHLSLAAQLADHSMRREYRAIVVGGADAAGTVDAPIGRSPRDRKKMAVLPKGASGAREAVTHYTLLEDFGQFSYLSLVLETGRTHQIRVHMSHIGHPVLGDSLYGGNRTPFERHHAPYLTEQCLHAAALHFTHPRSGEKMCFHSPLPQDFEHLLSILRTGR